MKKDEPALAPSVSLGALLPESRFVGADEISCCNCTADSRRCEPGDVFVALVGTEHDGHDHVLEAIARGASAIVAERMVPANGRPVCVVSDSRVAYGKICQALAGDPSRRMKIVGVTGTNGKTTTTCLVHSIFTVAGFRGGIMGTLGYCDGYRTGPALLTTPAAPTLAEYLARMVANDCTHAVLEVSSHALALNRTAGIHLDAACVTNVCRDHLDFHGSLQNYCDAKARIFDHLSDDGLSVLNLDDPVSRKYVNLVPGPVLTVGLNQPAEVNATIIERFPSEQTFLLQCGNDIVPVRTRIIGDHHVYNCLQAAAIGLAYGIDLQTIVRGIEAIDEVPGRLQRMECGQPFSVFVDYAHTPDALQVSLSTLRSVTRGRLICVFGAGGQRDREKRPLMGGQVDQWADMAVVTDDNPRGEHSEAIIGNILEGMGDGCEVVVQPDRAIAIDIALSVAGEGDCVVVAGKGHESYQLIGQQRVEFDDREVIRNWLRGAASAGAWDAVRRAA